MSWIRIPVAGEAGWPEQRRGAATSTPGLYFVGLPFLQAFASMLVGGVGRDAKYVARQIAARADRVSSPSRRRTNSRATSSA